MNWAEVQIETAKAGLDLLCANLMDLGFTGFVIHDPDDFEALMAGKVGHWDYLEDGLAEALTVGAPSVTVYIPENDQGHEQMAQLRSLIAQLKASEQAIDYGTLAYTVQGMNEADWANNWKQYFKPLCVGKKLWVTPTWVEDTPPTGRIVLRIDPGSSFGTGQHDTTKLCLAFLEDCVSDGCKVLDIGCGSGILSIGAMLLGAGSTEAIDIEQHAAESALENAVNNGIAAKLYHIYCGNILTDETLVKQLGNGYDVVCANIVSDILIAMKALFVRFMKPGATLLLSGIIEERLDEVIAEMKSVGLHVVSVETGKGWADERITK